MMSRMKKVLSLLYAFCYCTQKVFALATFFPKSLHLHKLHLISYPSSSSSGGKNTNEETPFSTSTTSTELPMSSSFTEEQLEKIPPRKLIQLGMQYFKQGDVGGSIELFDRAEKVDSSLRPFLWQRGISYYYADRFKDGSDQFRYDVKVNPLDVEEIVWDIACQYMANENKDNDLINKMSLPKGKTDRRKIMASVYSLFRGDGATEEDLVNAGHSGSASDEFYSLFYLGLWCEAKGELTKAESYMRAAVKSTYAQGANDYMTSVAKVHCKTRGWLY